MNKWIFPFLIQICFSKTIGKVSVELEAHWNSGPLFLEATEFIHSLGGSDGQKKDFLLKISTTEGLCSKDEKETLDLIKNVAADVGLSRFVPLTLCYAIINFQCKNKNDAVFNVFTVLLPSNSRCIDNVSGYEKQMRWSLLDFRQSDLLFT